MNVTDEKIQELCEAATPGPWKDYRDTFEPAIYTKLEDGCRGILICRMFGLYGSNSSNNASFIAAARELVPRLLKRAQKAEHLADVYRSEFNRCMDSARRQHRYLAKVTRELNDLRRAMQWVPVSERLPNEREPVLVRHTSQDGGITPMYRAAFLEDGAWYELNDWDDIYHITHWLPLPAAPPRKGM